MQNKNYCNPEIVDKILTNFDISMKKELKASYPEGMTTNQAINYLISLSSSFLGSSLLEVRNILEDKTLFNFSSVLITIMNDINVTMEGNQMHKTSERTRQ